MKKTSTRTLAAGVVEMTIHDTGGVTLQFWPKGYVCKDAKASPRASKKAKASRKAHKPSKK